MAEKKLKRRGRRIVSLRGQRLIQRRRIQIGVLADAVVIVGERGIQGAGANETGVSDMSGGLHETGAQDRVPAAERSPSNRPPPVITSVRYLRDLNGNVGECTVKQGGLADVVREVRAVVGLAPRRSTGSWD